MQKKKEQVKNRKIQFITNRIRCFTGRRIRHGGCKMISQTYINVRSFKFAHDDDMRRSRCCGVSWRLYNTGWRIQRNVYYAKQRVRWSGHQQVLHYHSNKMF